MIENRNLTYCHLILRMNLESFLTLDEAVLVASGEVFGIFFIYLINPYI